MPAKAKLAEKARTLLAFTESVCRGEKPANYPAEFYEITSRMAAKGFLPEVVQSYVTLADEDPEDDHLRRIKGVTSVHPISQKLMLRHDLIKRGVAADNINNWKIFGFDPYYRIRSENNGTEFPDPVLLAEDARALILTRSDMHGLRQALTVLIAKCEDDIRVKDTTLIIQNSGQTFWAPVLSYLGLDPDQPTTLEDIDTHVTLFPGSSDTPGESRASTYHVLKTLDPATMANAAYNDRMGVRSRKRRIKYVASGSGHKPREIGEIFHDLHTRVTVRGLSEKVPVKPREAEELSYSMEGNDLEKYHSVRHLFLNIIGYDNVVRMLVPDGMSPEDVDIIFDDRALSYMQRAITDSKAFAHTKAEQHPYKYAMQPSSELATFLKTYSLKNIFEEMTRNALDEVNATLPDDQKITDPDILDEACHLVVRLDWFLLPYPKYIATFATRRSRALTHQQPAGADPETDTYLYPRTPNENLPREQIRTKAQIENYITRDSEVSGSIRTLVALTQDTAKTSELEAAFENAADNPPREKRKIATIYSLFPSISNAPNMHSVFNGGFKLVNNREGRYDLEPFTNRAANIDKNGKRADDSNRARIEEALMNLRRLYQEADGFLFTPDTPELTHIPGIQWLKSLFYFSLVVGKQVDDLAIKSKFLGHLKIDPETNNKSWAPQERILEHLRRTPLLMNKYVDLLKDFGSKIALKEGLKKFSRRYEPESLPEKDVLYKDDGKEVPEDLYRVTIYCSASLGKTTQACKDARAFTYDLASRGFAIINGGGREGLMVATSEGVHDYRRDHGRTIRNHVTSYQCHDTYEREGGWHEDNDNAVILKTIEQRMAHLQNTDAEVLMAGGSGSIQEIAASVLMREWGLVPTRNRPLVIVNQKLDGIAVFDPLIGMFKKADYARLNIHVVDTIEEARNVIVSSRAAMSRDLGPGRMYIPANDNTPFAAPVQSLKVA